MPPKRKLNLKSTIQSSSTIAHFLPSSSSSSSAPPPTSPSIDLTSSPPLTTSSASTNQKRGKSGKTSYIWDHGTEYFVDRKSRWQCGYCSCTVLVSALQLQLSESISTISMEYQSECEEVNLWLKIKNMIGHYGF